MDTSAIVAVIAVIVVLVVAVLVVRPMLRRRRLQQRFGPEYDRVVQSHDNRAVAERELVEREKRYRQLELRPLSSETRERYSTQWTEVQARFVDAPESTVGEADRLVTALMAERGYPTEGYEQQLADLSVEHASTLEHYRAAHDVQERIGTGEASTEDMRTAMLHYRALFTELLSTGTDGEPDTGRPDTVMAGTAGGQDLRGDPGDLDTDRRDLDRDADRVDTDRRDADADSRAVDADVRDRDGDASVAGRDVPTDTGARRMEDEGRGAAADLDGDGTTDAERGRHRTAR